MVDLIWFLAFAVGCVCGYVASAVNLHIHGLIQRPEALSVAEPPAALTDEVTAPDAVGVLLAVDGEQIRFGKPQTIIYRASEWEIPLWCNGGDCPLPEIQEGQAIWLVPILDGSGELPCCFDCVDAVTPVAVAR